MVAGGAACAVDEADVALLQEFVAVACEVGGGRIPVQLFPVAVCELLKIFFFVSEPLAQGGRGGYLFSPFVNGCSLFGQSAGPETVDQDAVSVGRFGRQISPLDA